MGHSVIKNGLWGDKASIRVFGTGGGLSSTDLSTAVPYVSLTVGQIEEALEDIQRQNESRRMVLRTGPRGMRAFEEALSGIRHESIVDRMRPYTEHMHNLNYQRLQRGEITPVEYLDLISEEE